MYTYVKFFQRSNRVNAKSFLVPPHDSPQERTAPISWFHSAEFFFVRAALSSRTWNRVESNRIESNIRPLRFSSFLSQTGLRLKKKMDEK